MRRLSPGAPVMWYTHWLTQHTCRHLERIIKCAEGRMWTECLRCGHCTAGIQIVESEDA